MIVNHGQVEFANSTHDLALRRGGTSRNLQSLRLIRQRGNNLNHKAGSETVRQKKGTRWLIPFMWLAYLLNYGDRQVISSIFPILRRDLHFTELQLGLSGALFLWSYGLISPIAGHLGDPLFEADVSNPQSCFVEFDNRFHRFSKFACIILWLRAMTGITEALFLPAAIAILANTQNPKKRSLSISIFVSAQQIGSVLGGWFGGRMVETYSWRLAFVFLGGIGLIYAVPYALMLRRIVTEPIQKPGVSSRLGNLRSHKGAFFRRLVPMLSTFYRPVVGTVHVAARLHLFEVSTDPFSGWIHGYGLLTKRNLRWTHCRRRARRSAPELEPSIQILDGKRQYVPDCALRVLTRPCKHPSTIRNFYVCNRIGFWPFHSQLPGLSTRRSSRTYACLGNWRDESGWHSSFRPGCSLWRNCQTNVWDWWRDDRGSDDVGIRFLDSDARREAILRTGPCPELLPDRLGPRTRIHGYFQISHPNNAESNWRQFQLNSWILS